MTAAAFILIITVWGNFPQYSMQEFSSESACMSAKQYVEKNMTPPGTPMVLVKCVAK